MLKSDIYKPYFIRNQELSVFNSYESLFDLVFSSDIPWDSLSESYKKSVGSLGCSDNWNCCRSMLIIRDIFIFYFPSLNRDWVLSHTLFDVNSDYDELDNKTIFLSCHSYLHLIMPVFLAAKFGKISPLAMHQNTIGDDFFRELIGRYYSLAQEHLDGGEIIKIDSDGDTPILRRLMKTRSNLFAVVDEAVASITSYMDCEGLKIPTGLIRYGISRGYKFCFADMYVDDSGEFVVKIVSLKSDNVSGIVSEFAGHTKTVISDGRWERYNNF